MKRGETRFRGKWNWAAVTFACILCGIACPVFGSPLLPGELPHGAHFQVATANIYSETANAKEEIRIAILKAANEHKRVLLDFGGNWCSDCHLLNLYFHDPGNASLLAANYILVDVNVGEYDKNLDLARKYGIPLKKGVPALAVLDGTGRVVYAQRNGEFEAMSKLDSAAVSAFLMKWKPGREPVRRSDHPYHRSK